MKLSAAQRHVLDAMVCLNRDIICTPKGCQLHGKGARVNRNSVRALARRKFVTCYANGMDARYNWYEYYTITALGRAAVEGEDG